MTRSRSMLVPALTGLVAAGCATPLPPQEPLAVSPVQFSQRELRDVDNVMIVTDASASTYFSKTFPDAKALSLSFARALPDRSARAQSPEYNVGVIGFGGDDRVTLPLQPFDRQKVESTIDQIHVMGSIDGMGGTTPLANVIGEAGKELESQRGKAAVVFFTDGRPDNADDAFAAAKKLVEARPDTCLHGVQVGDDPQGAEFLRELGAVSPCGSARSSTTVASAAPFTDFTRTVIAGESAPLPAVAAAPNPCEGTIRLRGIEFAFDSAKIDPAGAAVLDAAAETLKRCKSVHVGVNGYTDWTGTEQYNQGLSDRRARAVSDYLSGEGVDSSRLAPKGYGESDPVAPNTTRDGRARNRRVELKPE